MHSLCVLGVAWLMGTYILGSRTSLSAYALFKVSRPGLQLVAAHMLLPMSRHRLRLGIERECYALQSNYPITPQQCFQAACSEQAVSN